MANQSNNYPKLHNATWPGVVGKGSPGAEPFIGFDEMLEMTAAAEVDGVKFDGLDISLWSPHVDIDSSDDDLKKLADKVRAKNLAIGSLVAPIWGGAGGGSAMGGAQDQEKFLTQVRKACAIGKKLREIGVRKDGVVRIDSSVDVASWSKDPEGNQKRIAETFRKACEVAEGYGEQLAAEGEICWGGMQSWKRMVQLFELVDRPKTLGFQCDMAHTLLYLLGYNAPEDALLPAGYDWKDRSVFEAAYRKLSDALRPWTIDFHVAQNDATVFGSGTHDKTGRHCLPKDPNGKLEVAKAAGYWLRDRKGELTRRITHLCWDGCMFPNAIMRKKETWNEILGAMIAVREAHGFRQ